MLIPYQEGRLAFIDGKPGDSNPYHYLTLESLDWVIGWNNAKDDYGSPPVKEVKQAP